MVPRLALGTIQPGADLQPVLWAMLDALRLQGVQVQTFLSRACFARFHGEAAATGLSPRHLDTWLMSPELCRETFISGSTGCDLSIVEGEFQSARRCPTGGSLDRLCDWLDLPRIIMLDATGCDLGLPARPDACDGVVIDFATDAAHLARLSEAVRNRWGVPVFGGLEALPALRTAIRAIPAGARPPLDLIEQLGRHFSQVFDSDKLIGLSMRRPLAWVPKRPGGFEALQPMTVALAYDPAFDCYFQDTLDALEAFGARLVDFSPTRDERLPEGVDVVYFGCGHLERFTTALSQNHCMKLALRNFVRRGGRLYAEGSGLAYLCQQMESHRGRLVRMAGLFPANARRRRPSLPPVPVEVTLHESTWLGPAETVLRGYRDPQWYLEPAGPLAACGGEPRQRLALVRSYRAIGSNIHINFAASPALLRSFFETRLAEPRVTDPWALV